MNIEKFWITLNSLCIFIVAIIAILAFSWSIPREEQEGYDTATEYMRELQVSYQGVKADLVDATQHYIDSVAPNSGLRALVLVEKCEEYGIPISFTLAQGEVESHFGTRGLAFRTNSVWNVGAYDSHIYSDIIRYKYTNPNNSINDYLSILDKNYLQGKTIEDLLESYVDTNGNRYASDKHYEVKLKQKVEYIKTNYSIDELQEKLYYYKIRL